MSDAVLLSVRVPPDRTWREFSVSHALTVEETVQLIARLSSSAFEGCPPIRPQAELMLAGGEQVGKLLERAATIGELVAQGVLSEGTELLAL